MRKLLLAFAMWFALSGLAIAAVNINTATKEELTSIKGIGEKRAGYYRLPNQKREFQIGG